MGVPENQEEAVLSFMIDLKTMTMALPPLLQTNPNSRGGNVNPTCPWEKCVRAEGL